MTHANRPLPSHTTASRTGSAARRRHASDFSDAVVAAYIRDISTRGRHRRPAAQPDDWRVSAKEE
jgi:hypothetical protein